MKNGKTLTLFSQTEMAQIKLIGKLIFTSPFSAERTEIEKKLLGRKHIGLYQVWHSLNGELSVNKNLPAIFNLCNHLVEKGLAKWADVMATADKTLLDDWDMLALYWLFGKYNTPMTDNIYLGTAAETENAQLYDDFNDDFNRVILLPNRPYPSIFRPEEIFALFHQIHRAFNYIFDFIAGGTMAAANLRTAIWQSIFTCDLYRYYRQLFTKMDTITTLITGESGTGKELVARAIAFSQFIPFDPKTMRFEEFYLNCFHPVQLSAMPQSLVESELFGHAKGAFTGAIRERHGHFETCQTHGCIFLDEIGDVSIETQAKLLRLLQTRQFQRIGDTTPISFEGKIIAASNIDLQEACRCGKFRQDLLFRICSDTIHTAPLRTLIDGQEDELRQFVIILAKRILDGQDAVDFASQCSDWIIKHLGMDYPWPGNVRELEQCLRNLLIRGDYTPMTTNRISPATDDEAFFNRCNMTADELLSRYIVALHKRHGSVLATAKASGMDRRTVKKYLDNAEC
ncbi:MAG: sigma-54-dependent Fis family transcriptional regulator [Victivallales bacterium]|nr:sigma-54-dependent Fis family transcriptional regulator [Victivallales bacterium]